MKLTVLALAGVMSLSAQQGHYKPISSFPEAQQARMAFARHAVFYLTGYGTSLGTYLGGPVSVTATDAQEDGSLLQFKGNVEIKTDSMILQADEIDLNRTTHEFEPRGNVRIKPVITAK